MISADDGVTGILNGLGDGEISPIEAKSIVHGLAEALKEIPPETLSQVSKAPMDAAESMDLSMDFKKEAPPVQQVPAVKESQIDISSTVQITQD